MQKARFYSSLIHWMSSAAEIFRVAQIRAAPASFFCSTLGQSMHFMCPCTAIKRFQLQMHPGLPSKRRQR